MKLSFVSEIVILFIAKAIANPVPVESNNFEQTIQADSPANCPAGFTQPVNSNWTSCYKVNPDFKSKKDAANQCRLNNGTLSSVPNTYVNSYIYYLASQVDGTSIWLGSECFNGDRTTCMNDDGTNFGFNNFKPGQPESSDNCVYMSASGRDSQQWSTFDCEQKFAYACEIPALSNVNLPTCPQNYTEFQGMCYTFYFLDKNRITGNDASAECRKLTGGNLATSGSSEVNNFLIPFQQKTVAHQQGPTAFGLRCLNVTVDGDTSSCRWDDGTPFVYNNFYKINHPFPFPVAGLNGCCDFNLGNWVECYSCDDQAFSAYFCQASMQIL